MKLHKSVLMDDLCDLSELIWIKVRMPLAGRSHAGNQSKNV